MRASMIMPVWRIILEILGGLVRFIARSENAIAIAIAIVAGFIARSLFSFWVGGRFALPPPRGLPLGNSSRQSIKGSVNAVMCLLSVRVWFGVCLILVGLCLGRCVATIELAKSSANLWGFCTLFAFIPGIDDQGAVGGAGGPSGPSVLLSPRSIPKDKGGVPWAPSPPVSASGISYWF